jgi:hypothetical protein
MCGYVILLPVVIHRTPAATFHRVSIYNLCLSELPTVLIEQEFEKGYQKRLSIEYYMSNNSNPKILLVKSRHTMNDIRYAV